MGETSGIGSGKSAFEARLGDKATAVAHLSCSSASRAVQVLCLAKFHRVCAMSLQRVPVSSVFSLTNVPLDGQQPYYWASQGQLEMARTGRFDMKRCAPVHFFLLPFYFYLLTRTMGAPCSSLRCRSSWIDGCCRQERHSSSSRIQYIGSPDEFSSSGPRQSANGWSADAGRVDPGVVEHDAFVLQAEDVERFSLGHERREAAPPLHAAPAR